MSLIRSVQLMTLSQITMRDIKVCAMLMSSWSSHHPQCEADVKRYDKRVMALLGDCSSMWCWCLWLLQTTQQCYSQFVIYNVNMPAKVRYALDAVYHSLFMILPSFCPLFVPLPTLFRQGHVLKGSVSVGTAPTSCEPHHVTLKCYGD